MKVSIDKNIVHICKSNNEQIEPLLDWILGYMNASKIRQISSIIPDFKGAKIEIEINDSTMKQVKRHCANANDVNRLTEYLLSVGISMGGVE